MSVIGDLVVRLLGDGAPLAATLGSAGGQLARFASQASSVAGKVRSELSGALGSFGLGGALLGGASLATVGKFVSLAGERAGAEKKLASVLRSTGEAAGFSAKELYAYADELQRTTSFSRNAANSGMAVMATFTSIRGSVFKDALKAVMDLSTIMGSDLQASVVQVGKALNDPIRGVTALREVGVSFTEEQQKQIKNYVESGNLLKAQQLILKELRTEFGGAAQEMASPVAQARAAMDELGAGIGQTIAPYVKMVAEGIRDWGASADQAGKSIDGLKGKFAGVQEAADKLADTWDAIARLGMMAVDPTELMKRTPSEERKAREWAQQQKKDMETWARRHPFEAGGQWRAGATKNVSEELVTARAAMTGMMGFGGAGVILGANALTSYVALHPQIAAGLKEVKTATALYNDELAKEIEKLQKAALLREQMEAATHPGQAARFGGSPYEAEQTRGLVETLARLRSEDQAAGVVDQLREKVDGLKLSLVGAAEGAQQWAQWEAAGVMPDVIEQAKSLTAELSRLEKLQGMMAEGKQLAEQFHSPLDAYAERVKHIQELLNSGSIDQATANAAAKEAEDKYVEGEMSRRGGPVGYAGAMEKGSREAWHAIMSQIAGDQQQDEKQAVRDTAQNTARLVTLIEQQQQQQPDF